MVVKETMYTRKEFGMEIESGYEIQTTKNSVSFWDMSDCPEDAIFGRGLSDAYNIISLMKEAYEAGKRGEPFEIVEGNPDE